MYFLLEQNILLKSADVAALYPSINIEEGTAMVLDTTLQHTTESAAQIPQPRSIRARK
jgi:hypothetical protein